MVDKVAIYFPECVVDNDELARLYPGWTADKIFEKTGIRRRRVAAEGQCASDLAAAAAEKLLAHCDRGQVDFLLFCTQTPDYLLPTTACLLQHRLQLSTRCGALDFNLGCSGYIYGLAMAQSLIQAGVAQTVLFLAADTYSRHIHPGDKSARTLFGDAGAATLLSSHSPRRLHSFVLRTDGSGAAHLMVRTGGARHARTAAPAVPQVDDSGNVRDPNCLCMNGPEIFNFTLRAVPSLVNEILARAGLRLDQIGCFVFHQANAYMLEHLRAKLRIPKERFVVCLQESGNTVSATIPTALNAALQSGQIQPGMKVLLAGFGVGLSWGGCVLDWNA